MSAAESRAVVGRLAAIYTDIGPEDFAAYGFLALGILGWQQPDVLTFLLDRTDEKTGVAAPAPTPCPVCGGAGIVDTSPPGVEHTAPWLQTDDDCGACDGTGEMPEETP